MKNDIQKAQAYLKCNPPLPDKAIEILRKYRNVQNTGSWVTFYLLGIAYVQKSDHKNSIKSLETARKKGGENIEILHLLMDEYVKVKEYDKAEVVITKILQKKEDYAAAWKNLGLVYTAQGNYEDALRVLGKANNFKPSDLSIAILAADAYFKNGNLDDSWKTCESILAVDIGLLDAHLGKARIHLVNQQFEAAKTIIDSVLHSAPKARNSRRAKAEYFFRTFEITSAISLLEVLLEEDSGDYESRVLYAECLIESKKFEDAESQFTRALTDGADPSSTLPKYVESIIHNPDFDPKKGFHHILKKAKQYAGTTPVLDRISINKEDSNRKINLGFISDRFWENPEGLMYLSIFSHLPKDRFNLNCYSVSRKSDRVSNQISKICERFHFVFKVSSTEFNEFIRKNEIDILIDLTNEFSEKAHHTILQKPAPVQLKWKSKAKNPIELKALDFLITSGEEASHQKVNGIPNFIHLPEAIKLYIPPKMEIEVGSCSAKNNGFITFASFNAPKKINSVVVEHWAEILKQVDGSKMLFSHERYKSAEIRDQIIEQFEELDISADRMFFEEDSIREARLSRLKKVDILLDSFPQSDPAIISDALWMGIPVISKSGEFLEDTVSNFLHVIGYSEFLAANREEYISIAVDLAGDIGRLSTLRNNLRNQVLASALCDAPRFATHLTKVFTEVWHQRVNGKGQHQKNKKWQSDIFIEVAGAEEIEQIGRSNSNQNPEETDTSFALIPELFWDGYISTEKAEKTVQITQKFYSNDFTSQLLAQIIQDTEVRLEESPSDNVAFFVQTRALLALAPQNEILTQSFEELDEHLTRKNWWFKRAIYNYWFERVDWIKQEFGTTVSAIIIANKFKERSVENLKKLTKQLDGIGEIIFVNNGLDDHEFDRLMPFITTYVKAKGNSGAYLARNLGAIFARSKYLVFVDDDGIPDEGFISAHLKEHEERDIVVSRGVYYSGNVIDDPVHYNIGAEVKPAYTILEGNAMYNATSFYLAGGWGDYILFGHGGKDLSYRLLEYYPEKDKQIYVPGSRLHHEYIRGEAHKSEKFEKQTISLKLIEALHPGLTDEINKWPVTFSEGDAFKENIKPALLPLPENKESKFIHLCRNHVYAQTLSDMIESLNNSSNQQHWLLVEKTPWNVGGGGYSIEEGKNASTIFFDCNAKSDMVGIIRELIHPEVTAVFMHGLFRNFESNLLNAVGPKKHIGWIIWGGDLYNPIQRNQHLVFPHKMISSIHSVMQGDVELFTKYYGEKPSFEFTYPYPALYGEMPIPEMNSSKKIIVGNSGDASNNHIEILHQLAEKEDIHQYELILPVAYNFKADYKAEVENVVEELGLSELVKFHTEFMAPEDYRALISEVDMLIMAHDRQQAIGNSLMGLYMDKPVFMKREILVNGERLKNPGWKFLEKNGLNALSFEDFKSFKKLSIITDRHSQFSTNNQAIIKNNFGLKARADLLERNCNKLVEMINQNGSAVSMKSKRLVEPDLV